MINIRLVALQNKRNSDKKLLMGKLYWLVLLLLVAKVAYEFFFYKKHTKRDGKKRYFIMLGVWLALIAIWLLQNVVK